MSVNVVSALEGYTVDYILDGQRRHVCLAAGSPEQARRVISKLLPTAGIIAVCRN